MNVGAEDNTSFIKKKVNRTRNFDANHFTHDLLGAKSFDSNICVDIYTKQRLTMEIRGW